MICDEKAQFMRKCAILVIAAQNQEVYVHYINTYWTSLIRYTNAHVPNIDVFLLFEKGSDIKSYSHLSDNIIEDQNSDFNELSIDQKHSLGIPGILSKIVYAFEKLRSSYDVFFRTNLSSMIHMPNFRNFLNRKEKIIYSGSGVWEDSLRSDLIFRKKVGNDQSIKSLEELEDYQGNTFISGSAYFMNAEEVDSLLKQKSKIRYDIIDDVSIGLMMSQHENLKGFTLNLKNDLSIEEISKKLYSENYCHVRLQHFPLYKAQTVWSLISEEQLQKGNGLNS
jgi:hypothetical protein